MVHRNSYHPLPSVGKERPTGGGKLTPVKGPLDSTFRGMGRVYLDPRTRLVLSFQGQGLDESRGIEPKRDVEYIKFIIAASWNPASGPEHNRKVDGGCLFPGALAIPFTYLPLMVYPC